ncbi:glycosyl hydrolase 2 galactose-binding domain-containing protein [Actinomadura sp. HBU206391]|uniref:glycosyl hydrolase 2 galactose-binding domain-containing protein n=1 Tax=Actinomadura sp. HBU206391 TaxID=2731692 RepID=UPI00164FDEEF|nr:sugar-binding domain-containing protein [Actinomadura sp. HBU206391]MBC6458356.1 beta-mannosidase [Actinomadura sp. HBU206391]
MTRSPLVSLVVGVVLAAAVTSCSMPRTSPAGAASATATAPGTGLSELTTGWKIQSSAVAGTSGARISRPDYSPTGWLSIKQPETVMAGLLENGRYPNIFYSDHLKTVPTEQFAVNWWYRLQLDVNPRKEGRTFLIMNGVLGTADLWVNGTKVADRAQLQGAYSRLEYDITPYVRDGANAIALDVAKNDPKTQLTDSQLDWNPPAPDHNTGLRFPPQLAQAGQVSLRNVHVNQRNAKDLGTSDLTLKADLRNDTASAQRAELTQTITRGPTRIALTTAVTVPAKSTRRVTLTPADHPQLRLVRPAVWWPYQLGGQPLYHLDANVRVGGEVSDRFTQDFGIRTVTSRLTPVVPGKTHTPHGNRQFFINGVPLVIRGGGWSPDMFMRYSPRNIRDQLSYVKNLGLNTLRFEGNLPPDDMFAEMDRAGILAMAGWQCCDKWETPSSTWSEALKTNAGNQASRVAQWLRNHPSVFTFFHGSDEAPDAAKEPIYLSAFDAADWQTPQVAAAEYKSSPRLGISGAKEGPYNYVPPGYWWANGPETAGTDETFTNAGSAWGYGTETSAGNTVPTQDSLDRFLPPAEQRKIWDPSTAKGPDSGPDLFHVYPTYNSYTKTARMGQYNTPMWNRYGGWSDMASYQKIAQMSGYETTRAQFEAYIGHSKDPANPSTGVIYWMANKAWPSLHWNLYNYDFDQPGVYFGALKAGEPVHIMYDYAGGSIKVANLTGESQKGLTASARFIDLNGTVKRTDRSRVPDLASQDVRTVLTPAVPAGISRTYFLELTLTRDDKTVSRNVYWLSTKPDAVDWSETLGKGSGAVFAPGGYADLTGLRNLAPAAVRVSASTRREGDEAVTTVTIRNAARETGGRGVPAVFTRADVRRGTADGRRRGGDDQVLPIVWTDNNVTLWPGQSQTLTARYRASDLRGAPPVVSITGRNVRDATVPVGD